MPRIRTIAECVGGCADGVQFDPEDPNEPDDWPCGFMIKADHGGQDRYELRTDKYGIQSKPKRIGGQRVYYYDVVR